MNVISMDVGPKKGATAFDGKTLSEISALKLPAHCDKLSKSGTTLICWDAPLTGPANPNSLDTLDFAYTQRIIEKFFQSGKTGFKTPAGISVLPYSGCPHWTITRASLGLPRLGRFDVPNDQLPFPLVHSTKDIMPNKNCAVEIHPAVAMWLWCKDESDAPGEWIYKGAKRDLQLIEKVWNILRCKWEETNLASVEDMLNSTPAPTNDDELDAIVGWVLGALLVERQHSIGILGGATTGSFALPIAPELQTAFDAFCEQNEF